MFGIDDAAIATILAGLVSTAGSLYANRKNIDAQQQANSINWEIARQNNATQIEMANTAHQREVRDLRRAGLNPILSAGGNGSSTPSLSAATITPTHTDNAFEGLANSAKGLGRYFGEQYRTSLAQAQASARLTSEQAVSAGLENDYNRALTDANKFELDATRSQAHNDWMRSVIERQALCDLFGADSRISKQGNMVITDGKAFRHAVDLAKEGIQSDMKVRSNANWRANLSSFVPFGSPAATILSYFSGERNRNFSSKYLGAWIGTLPAAVNSAASAAQRIKYLLK